ncbi:MAG: helix-turn-helix domain-containing protein [Oscillospiraceae bacterium]|nr:helix-turn-helix domain-containing protein [Oscillospiraceae bacterium]
MKIGEVIKKLRKERDVTQEKLADYLGISYQAVSKWENGTALPDITLVVPLANFFGVSADELFSLNEQINDEKVKEYEAQYRKFNNLGDTQNCIEIMREALVEYPKNYKFMLNLSSALFGDYAHKGDNEEQIKEIITLCERILEDCTEDSTRHGAIQLLCYNYPKNNQRDKAIELAKKMPDITSRELLASIYEGEEKIKTLQGNILQYIDCACMDLGQLTIQKDLTVDEKILCTETSIKLYETIFYDGNFGFYNCRLAWEYLNLAKLRIDMEYLLKAEKHAVAFDELNDAEYTSLFANKLNYSKAHIGKNWIGTECGLILERLDDKCFDPIRENSEFIALKQRLTDKHSS